MSLSGYVKYFGNNRPVIPEDTRGHRLGSSIYNPSASTEPPQHGSGYTSTPEPTDDVSSGPPFGIPVIAVMGPTGSGKSTLISRLASQSVRIGHNLVSCTTEPEEVRCKIGDKIVVLVDTPGFNDTFRSDTEILEALVDWMKGLYQETKLSGIIYLHDIKLDRMYGSSLNNLRMFRKLCGDNNLKNVILATTKWSEPPKPEEESRKKELCSNDEFWALMVEEGSMVREFYNTKASARALVDEILTTGTEDFTPQIHVELEQGKKLSETEAGSYIDQRLIDLAKRHKEEVEGLMEEQDRARRKQDRKMEARLEKQRMTLEQRIKEREEQQHTLHLDKIGRLEAKIQELQKATNDKNDILINNQKWYSSTWKCLICKTKTSRQGRWTCPNCHVVQSNLVWDPDA